MFKYHFFLLFIIGKKGGYFRLGMRPNCPLEKGRKCPGFSLNIIIGVGGMLNTNTQTALYEPALTAMYSNALAFVT